MTLTNKENELKVAIWMSGTHKQFLLHLHYAIHKMGFVTNFAKTKKAVETSILDMDLTKGEYM